MKTLEIATLHRVQNGWLVTVPSAGFSQETYLCATWDEVEKRIREAAFYFPHYTDPRMP